MCCLALHCYVNVKRHVQFESTIFEFEKYEILHINKSFLCLLYLFQLKRITVDVYPTTSTNNEVVYENFIFLNIFYKVGQIPLMFTERLEIFVSVGVKMRCLMRQCL